MRIQFLLAWILFVLVAVPGVAGFSVSSVATDPSGELYPDTPVTVTFEIPCKDIGLYDQMVITTDVRAPEWDTRIIINKKESPVISANANGNKLTIPGAVFNLERGSSGAVRIRLKGTVPSDPSSGQRLLHIRQLDADGTEYAYPSGFDLPMASPVTPASVTPSLSGTVKNAVTPVQTAQDSSFADLIASEPTDQSFGQLIGATPGVTTIPAKKSTLSVPTPWSGETQTPASPVNPLVALGASVISLYVMRRV